MSIRSITRLAVLGLGLGQLAIGCQERELVAPAMVAPTVVAPAMDATLPSPQKTPPQTVSNPKPSLSPDAAVSTGPERRVHWVVAIGDSLTDRRGGGGLYLDYLKERCPESRFDNFGKGGDMVNMMRRRFEREVLPQADAGSAFTDLIVFGGVNDLYSDLTAGRTNDDIMGDLSAMYEAGHQRGLRVIAITVAPWAGLSRYFNQRRSDATLLLNQWIVERSFAKPNDVVVDAYPLLSCGNSELLCPEYALGDKVHMSPAGHRVLGKALFDEAFSSCR